MKLTIFFNGQFWTGLIERKVETQYYSTLHIFGEEPKDGDIWKFISFDLLRLIEKQTESVAVENSVLKKINPKRLKRIASKELSRNPLSTKSQDAIQKQLEVNKKERKKISKELKEEQAEYKRTKRVEKRKKKHKGR
ncbi:MAG: YjdF family protein [Rhodothermaceae bacterium]